MRAPQKGTLKNRCLKFVEVEKERLVKIHTAVSFSWKEEGYEDRIRYMVMAGSFQLFRNVKRTEF